MIHHATKIPPLLIAVDHFWINQNREWPDWIQICLQDVSVLRTHPWWAKAAIKDKRVGQEDASLISVLEKKVAEVSAEIPSEVEVVELYGKSANLASRGKTAGESEGNESEVEVMADS